MLGLVPTLGVRARGFSLVELMIGIAIMAIAVSLGMPSYRIWIENTRIRNGAESIQTGLQKARFEALKRNVPVQLVLGANSAWTLSCVTATQCADLIGGVLETRTVSEGSSASITVTPTPAASTTIVFTNIGTVMPSPPAASAPFTQVDIDSSTLSATDSRDLRVMISAGGIGRMCDPYSGLSASDPRKC
ncbi:MAG: GspH/FimT family pseudopilin [Methylotenera sp.]|nr:GspH/FimT family pseudopilin [Methylotenera sp.]